MTFVYKEWVSHMMCSSKKFYETIDGDKLDKTTSY